MQAPVAEWLKSDPELTDDKLRDRLNDVALAQYAGKEGAGRPRAHAPVRAQPHAADARPALARSPGQPRPPAAGHPPARLRAEESEAGVQARIVRALLRHARPDQARRGQGRADGAGAHAGGRAGGRGGAAGLQRQVPARRLRRGARRGAADDPPHGRARRSCAPGEKVGRNDPCPCGSGKKYKQCHGRLA